MFFHCTAELFYIVVREFMICLLAGLMDVGFNCHVCVKYIERHQSNVRDCKERFGYMRFESIYPITMMIFAAM